MVINSNTSFVGSWSDIFFSIFISILIIFIVLKNWKNLTLLNRILKFISFGITIPTIIITGLIAYKTSNQRFSFHNINNREFNAYLYNPNIWKDKSGILKISEKSKNIPFLEFDLGNYSPPNNLRKGLNYEKNYIIQKKIVKKFIYKSIILPEIIRVKHLKNLESNSGIENQNVKHNEKLNLSE